MKAPPRRRRWLRLVVPYTVLLILLTVTGVAYAIQEPDVRDPDFLSPTNTAADGGSKLADRLRARGVPIEHLSRTPDALISAHRGNAILFIPAPDVVHPYYLRMLKLMPASTAVVLVQPGQRVLGKGRLPAAVAEQRWAADAVAPRCGDPVAAAAGRASVLRNRYTGEADQVTDRCYGTGLIRVTHHDTTLTLVGANDPFRNNRIDEHGNSALAVGLLAGGPTTDRGRRVVWLTVHGPEPGPTYIDAPGVDERPAPASLGRGSGDPDFPVPDPEGTDPGQPEPGLPRAGDGGEGGGTSVSDLFPATAWTVLALAAVAALLAGLARARRLGAPIPEPLPVLVPSTETVTGRGRLYERARDRGAALAILRTATRDRLARLLDQPPDVDEATLARIIAAHSGWPEADVATLLSGRQPEGDAELVAEAAALESLIASVTRVPAEGKTHREERL